MAGRVDRPEGPQNERRSLHEREERGPRGHHTENGRVSPSRRPRRSVSSRQFGGARRSLLSVSGIALLTATKAADAATTAVGLVYVPGIYEANTLIAFLLHRVGVATGLLVSSFAVIVVIALITEIASITVCARRTDAHLATVVRLVGYGIPSVLFAAVSVYNVTKLVTGVETAALI